MVGYSVSYKAARDRLMCCLPQHTEGKEGNVLLNDTLNTFYLRLYGVGHMVKNHSDSERGNPLLTHGLIFLISNKGSFIYASSHRQDSTYHSLCYTSCGALAGTRNSSTGPQVARDLLMCFLP